jgi:hypothetical protein
MLENISTKELEQELYKRKASTAKPRYEITGTWSGYSSGQRRVVHREYTTDKKFADNVKELGSIRYSDGTWLDLSVRQMEYREKKQQVMLSYYDLIRKCILKGVSDVKDLQ